MCGHYSSHHRLFRTPRLQPSPWRAAQHRRHSRRCGATGASRAARLSIHSNGVRAVRACPGFSRMQWWRRTLISSRSHLRRSLRYRMRQRRSSRVRENSLSSLSSQKFSEASALTALRSSSRRQTRVLLRSPLPGSQQQQYLVPPKEYAAPALVLSEPDAAFPNRYAYILRRGIHAIGFADTEYAQCVPWLLARRLLLLGHYARQMVQRAGAQGGKGVWA